MTNTYQIRVLALVISLLTFITGCGKGSSSEENEEKIFEKLDPSETGVLFINEVPENDSLNHITYHYLYNGNGIGCGDLNNDGLPDLVISGNTKPAEIYQNKGDFKFENITAKAGLKTRGWMSGVTLADVNNDGFLDIYICKSGPSKIAEEKRNYLFINNKNMTFTEKAAEYGVADDGNSTCATFFDMDNDGDLDLYVGNHGMKYFADIETRWTPTMLMEKHNEQHLYRNEGNKFTDISKESGILSMGFCLSASPGDFNKDGLTDLYVCHDYHYPDRYYLNKGNGVFEDVLQTHIKHMSTTSMGSDVGDYNNDGALDIFTADMLYEDPRRFSLLAGPSTYEFFKMGLKNGYGKQFMHNGLQTNNGDGTFSNLAFLNGVGATDWSWSPLFADFDNDGFKDLFVSNGYYRDVTNLDFIEFQNFKSQKKKINSTTKEILEKLPLEKLKNYMYKNKGNYSFKNVTADWGLDDLTLSTSAIYNDLNNDGELDLILSNQGEPLNIYKNVNKKGHYLNIKCKGGKKNNSFGIGAKILINTDSLETLYEMQHTHGYQSSTDAIVHFGCGNRTEIKELTVVWPNGEYQTLKNVKADQLLALDEKEASGKYNWKKQEDYLFSEIAGLDFEHIENPSNDFKQQFVLPHWFSRLGPGLTTGDVNGDGLIDVFITNAFNSAGSKLFLQTPEGKFRPAPVQPWTSQNKCDALGCLLFDADNDKDLDLFVVGGGSEHGWDPKAGWAKDYYPQQLYFNDGKGNFTNQSQNLPEMNTSGSCITAADYDLDGDLDLFVAGRVLPQFYPQNKIRSYLLRNDNGRFYDVTRSVAPDLAEAGMFCAAVFCDWNNDNKPDLVVSGEFLKVAFLANENGKFVFKNEASPSQIGWYNSILPVDIDADGDLDFVCGNKGQNSFLRAGNGRAVGVYGGDFDNSSTWDIAVYYKIGNDEYPANSLDEMKKQYPVFMANKFRNHVAFAGKKMTDIFGADNKPPLKMEANEFSSLVLINKGGSFESVFLPPLGQTAPLFGICTADFDNNGIPDVLGIGNNFSTRTQHGWDDAMDGIWFELNKGRINLETGHKSGMLVPGDGKALGTIPVGNYIYCIATQNNDRVKMFKDKTPAKFLAAKPGEIKALVTTKTGAYIQNLCYGGGYLTATYPGVYAGSAVSSVIFIDGKGQKRTVTP